MQLLIHLLCLAAAVYLVSRLLPGMRLRGIAAALSVAVVFSLLNFLLFKVLILITFPLVLLKWATLGLFGVVINASLLLASEKLIDGLELASFWTAVWAALGISLTNAAIHHIFGL